MVLWCLVHTHAHTNTHLIKRDGVLLENLRGYEGHLVAEVSWARLERVGEEPVSQPFQPPSVLWGNGVPGLGGPEVEVVDTVGGEVERWSIRVILRCLTGKNLSV